MEREEVWSLLQSVRALRFNARSEVATGWDGNGAGSVRVSEPEPGVIVFNEAGIWQSSGGAEVHFTNVFRWSSTGESLRLEHLRFGPKNPVFLFDLVPGANGEWNDVSPHMCREDSYRATLVVEGRQLLVSWSITGPRKRESIKYIYSSQEPC